MKSSVKLRFLTILTLFIMLVASACSSGGKDSATSPDSKGVTATTAASTKPDAIGTKIDPFGKYNPPIEISTVRVLPDSIKYGPGDSIESNIWTKYFKDELGITLKNQWVVVGKGLGSQGEQKMNVAIASGDLPDLIPNLTANQLKMLVDADLVMDLKDIYDKYASPQVKEFIDQDKRSIPSATFKGKLMALPNVASYVDQGHMIWVREDWRKKLNLPEPKTMEDVYKISEAFTKMDPDGNGKNDTFGLAMDKNLTILNGFLNGFHAYNNIWIRDKTGALVYSSIQPEVKNALVKLQEIYKSGQMDKEFGVKDFAKVAESFTSGKNGLYFGGMASPLYPLQANHDNDKDAQWQSYPLVSFDSQPARPQAGFSVNDYTVIKKGAKHPEAAVKMLNAFVENIWGKSNKADPYISHDNINTFLFHPVQAWPVRKNLDKYLKYRDIIDKKKDASILNAEEKNDYDRIQQFYKGEEKFWGLDRIFGPTGSFAVIDKYVANNLYVSNDFFGAPTPTMADKLATLQKMQIEFTRIILGAPVAEFDDFVANWKKAGGDQMTKEVNDWDKTK